MLRRLVTVDIWALALADLGALRHGAAPTCILRSPDPQRFWADPFIASPGGNDLILCEEYDYQTRRGSIVALHLDADGHAIERNLALDSDTHHSYPFTFISRGEWRCMPESSAAGSTWVYRVREDGRLVEPLRIDIEPDALDTTLLDHCGHLYLFYTTESAPEVLQIRHADELEGPWRVHPDSGTYQSNVRPAGAFFTIDGSLHRPAQDSSKRYGGAIRLLRVTEVSPRRYAEVEVEVLDPPNGWDGMHTINQRRDNGAIVDLVERASMLRHRSFLRWRLAELRRRLFPTKRNLATPPNDRASSKEHQ